MWHLSVIPLLTSTPLLFLHHSACTKSESEYCWNKIIQFYFSLKEYFSIGKKSFYIF